MHLIQIKFYFDAGSGICLWAADAATEQQLGYAIELSQLPLSENTQRWLTHLISWFDTSVDWSEPTRAGQYWKPAEQQRFQASCQIGLDLLRNDLPASGYRIECPYTC
ncbi:MAG: hypothetical protein WA154_14670 [Moraxellaceae bacterium]